MKQNTNELNVLKEEIHRKLVFRNGKNSKKLIS